MLTNLQKYQIILASKSPRRRELLEKLSIPFQCVTMGGIREDYPKDLPAAEVAEYLARLKADAYRSLITSNQMVITADTVVICEGDIFGKPASQQEAFGMIRRLSGRRHTVASGVSVITADRCESFTSETQVRFASLSDAEIEYYIDTFHPLDKAGAYGIQEWIGCAAVESIEGSFYNVMGLPLHRLYQVLKTF